MRDPASVNIPSWFLNRRKDMDTGNNFHLMTSDMDFNVRNDIEREKGMNSWRGFRHTYGLKVRGQSTRTRGRKGGAVGVKKGGRVLRAGSPGAPPAGAAAAAPNAGAAPAPPAPPKPRAPPTAAAPPQARAAPAAKPAPPEKTN